MVKTLRVAFHGNNFNAIAAANIISGLEAEGLERITIYYPAGNGHVTSTTYNAGNFNAFKNEIANKVFSDDLANALPNDILSQELLLPVYNDDVNNGGCSMLEGNLGDNGGPINPLFLQLSNALGDNLHRKKVALVSANMADNGNNIRTDTVGAGFTAFAKPLNLQTVKTWWNGYCKISYAGGPGHFAQEGLTDQADHTPHHLRGSDNLLVDQSIVGETHHHDTHHQDIHA
jgi:hypothetical protein